MGDIHNVVFIALYYYIQEYILRVHTVDIRLNRNMTYSTGLQPKTVTASDPLQGKVSNAAGNIYTHLRTHHDHIPQAHNSETSVEGQPTTTESNDTGGDDGGKRKRVGEGQARTETGL